MQLTSTQAFHHRWSAAMAAGDVYALRALYQPGSSVQLSLGTGLVLMGAESIAAGYAETFGVVGGVVTAGVERFIDLGFAYVAESWQSSGYASTLSYDVFVLEGGLARYHVSGSVAPRTPAALPAESAAPGQYFYRQVWDATNARDLAALAQLYAPDAVRASAGVVQRGSLAILQSEQQTWAQGGGQRISSLSTFVEGPNILAAEGVIEAVLMDTTFSLEIYDVWLMRGGQGVLNISGLINPRPEELNRLMQRVASSRRRAERPEAYGPNQLESRPYSGLEGGGSRNRLEGGSYQR
jgi:ketosteroid isomerase-like protein